MKIRGVFLAMLVMIVFFASYACAIEPEPEEPSSAKPVMVPYINKSIAEVNQYGISGTETDVIDGYTAQADEGRREAGQSLNATNDITGALLTDTGRMEKGENRDEDIDEQSLPELVGPEPAAGNIGSSESGEDEAGGGDQESDGAEPDRTDSILTYLCD